MEKWDSLACGEHCDAAPLPVMVCCHVLGCELRQISCYFRSSRAVLAGRVKISGVSVGGKPGELLQKLQGKPFACMTQCSLRDTGSAAWRQTHPFVAAVETV